MFIKKLELLGFKTFADKTILEFGSGITGIVGPNGCGKSNIADALQWVLGEANIRNLRGQKATDVIFYGSDKRKPLGVAEVSLTLDNTCGTLPINFSEVTVTRRAYRSGESEYFINKTRCRLKDIYELFLDTGIGREAYSFVTQGEIDAILSAKAEDRRELIEEAAGIKKYRYRRQEALKKLEKTEANLTRVCDIMSELSSQIEPLRQQAEQAKIYNEMQARLRQIEVGILVRDLKRFTQLLAEARDSKKDISARIEAVEKMLADLEWEKDKQTSAVARIEEQVEEARHIHQNLSSNVQRLEGKAALIEERLNSAQSLKLQAENDIANLEKRIEESKNKIASLKAEESEFAANENEIRKKVDEKTKELAELDDAYEKASSIINDQKASYLELAKELAAKRNALQNSKERVSQLEALLAKYNAEIESLKKQRDDAGVVVDDANKKIESCKVLIQECAEEIARLANERKKAEKKIADLRRMSAELSREIASRTSRLQTLREMAEAHEGFYEGVRTVMAAHKAGKLQGEFAVIADVITVPKGYETAIETALGGSVQDIITDNVNEAKRAIEFLKENKAGRATFLPLDNMRPSNTEVRGNLDRRSGALGIAAELIQYDSKYEPAIWSLLGRTVIVDNIDNAVALSRNLTGWNKIVTIEGELIMPSGAITGGAKKNKGPELLSRKQEIDFLSQEIKNLDNEVAAVHKDLQKEEKGLLQLESQSSESEKHLSETRVALAEQQRRSDFAVKEIERISRQLDMVILERDEADLMKKEEMETASRLDSELSEAGKENRDIDQKVAIAEEDVEELGKKRVVAREELMKLNIELAGCVERISAIRNSLAESQKFLNELISSSKSRHSQVGEVATDLAQLSQERKTILAEIASQRELLAAAESKLNELLAQRAAEHEKSVQIDNKLREAGIERNNLAQSTHDADLREARLEVQINQITERLLEEYEISYEEALKWPDDEIEIERGAATEVARLRREIKAMGPVNIGAIEEYERVKERWDFLSAQRADLESGRDQINAAIREIDTNTRGMFMDTFNSVAANFDKMFKRLFGGGRTELTLTDPNNLLETGIEIMAQPPGKKPQDLSCLSGGERALSATAFIFALLIAKPSPFVVLDEVDAPLDESNIERFAEVLSEFSKKTQFIIVTHNRATMEASDNLYGVTMQEPGVSKIISVRLSKEAGNDSQIEEREKIPEAQPTLI